MSGRFGNFTPYGIGLSELLTSARMADALVQKAEKIAENARAMSPVGADDDPHRGLYRDSWRVEHDIKQGTPRPYDPNRRARAIVRNDVDYAAAIEFGNGRRIGRRSFNVPHYTLTRALDAARE